MASHIASIFAAAIAAALIVAVAVIAILRRSPQGDSDSSRLAAEQARATRMAELERQIAQKELEFNNLRDSKSTSDCELATAREALAQTEKSLQHARAQIAVFEIEMKEGKGQLEAARIDRAKSHETAAAKTEEADNLRRERDAARTSLDSASRELVDLRSRLSALQESLDQERRHAEEKLTLLSEARERMGKEFKVLAEEVMAKHGEAFSRQNKEQVEGILTPLREKLAEFQLGLQTAHTESAKDRATLAEQIKQLSEQSAKMSTETHNLTRALKGKAQTQGAWGELILETILERSGLREGDEYTTQQSIMSEDGSRLRPDVVVNLPNSQRLVVDSKVSLTAFEAYVNAETDGERAQQLTKHIQSMRAHMRGLGAKDYQTASGSNLDYVIMFVPIEGALAAALVHDPTLTSFAAENNVAIATPTTLMIALRTVANVWQVERRNRNAEAIAARAGALYDKFHGFASDLQRLGNQLGTARSTYDDAMKKLSTGSGNLIRQAELLKSMGAKTTKALPTALLEDDV